MVEAQLVAPRRHPEINFLNRAPVRHSRICENHSVKGEKKAYGQSERNASGGGHWCTPSIRQWTRTNLTLCLRVRCDGPHTDGKMFITSSADSHCVFHTTFACGHRAWASDSPEGRQCRADIIAVSESRHATWRNFSNHLGQVRAPPVRAATVPEP